MAVPSRFRGDAVRSGVALASALIVALALVGCGGSSGGGGPADLNPPELRFVSFQTNQTVVQSGRIPIAWIASDADDEATVSIFADLDGDLGTGVDRHTVVDELAESDGNVQRAEVDTSDMPGGSYAVIGRIRDGKGGEVQVTAPGRLVVDDRSLVAPIGGNEIEIVDHLPRADGSFDVLGRFRGVVELDPRHRLNSTSRTWDVFVAHYTSRGVIRRLSRFECTGDMEATDFVRDANGDFLVAGSFGGVLTLPDRTTVRAAGADLFVARMSEGGEHLWVQTASSPNGDIATGIALLADGSLVASGAFNRGNTTYPIDFGPDRNGVPVTLASAGVGDAFVARFESDGTPIWARSAGGAADDRGLSVAVLDGDRIVVGGSFEGTAEFDGGTPRTASGGADGFLTEWSLGGQLVRVDTISGTGAEEIVELARCANGDLVLLANSTSELLDVVGQSSLQLASGSDATLTRFAPNGIVRWASGLAVGAGACAGTDVDPLPDGSFVVAGTYADGAQIGRGGPVLAALGATDGFAARLNADGSVWWLRRFSAADTERGMAISARDDGTALVTGDRGASALEVHTQRGNVTLAATAATSDFLARFNPDGELGRDDLTTRLARSGTIARGGITITVDGINALLHGFDDAETTPAIRELIRDYPMVGLLVLQRADGPIRGHAHLDAARAIAAAGLETHIPFNGSAYGGGIDLFLGGRRRTAEAGANVSVRSWVDANRLTGHALRNDRGHPEHRRYLELYDALGVPQDYYWFYLEVPRDAPRALTRPELEQYQIVTD